MKTALFHKKEKGYIKKLSYKPDVLALDQFGPDGRQVPAKEIASIKQILTDILTHHFSKKQREAAFISKDFLSPYAAKVNRDFIKLGKKYLVVLDGLLGKGAFSEVMIAQDIDTGKCYAVKKQTVSKIDKAKYEVETKLIKHEYDVLIGVGQGQKKGLIVQASLSDPNLEYHYLVMELSEGYELADLLFQEIKRDPEIKYLSRPLISPLIRLEIAINLVEAQLNRVYKKGYFHLDMKSQNAIVKLVGQVVNIIDFGYAEEIKKTLFKKPKVENYYLKGSPPHIDKRLREKSADKPASTMSKSTSLSSKSSKSSGTSKSSASKQEVVVYDKNTEIYALAITLAELCACLNVDRIRELLDKSRSLQVLGDESFVETKDKDMNDNPYFKHNASMPRSMLEAYLNILNEMLEGDTDKRLVSYTEIMKRLKKIKEDYLSEEKVKVGLLDVDEYLASTWQEKLAMLAPFMEIVEYSEGTGGPTWQERKINEMLLIDTGQQKRSDMDYAKVKRELEKLHERDDSCDLVVMDPPFSPGDFDKLPGQSRVAYVICGNQFYFVDKWQESYVEINMINRPDTISMDDVLEELAVDKATLNTIKKPACVIERINPDLVSMCLHYMEPSLVVKPMMLPLVIPDAIAISDKHHMPALVQGYLKTRKLPTECTYGLGIPSVTMKLGL